MFFQTMEHGFVDGATLLEVLHDDALQQFGSNARIPDSLWVDHDNRPTTADTKARRFATLHARRSKEQAFAFEQTRELCIQCATAAIRGTESASAHENVAPIRLQQRSR